MKALHKTIIATKWQIVIVLILIFSEPSQSAVQSCEKSLPDTVKKNLCAMRQYIILEGAEYDAHIGCIFKNFGYLKNNKIDDNAVQIDFNATSNMNKASKNDIERCALQANKQQNANSTSGVFLKCMVYSDSFEKFRNTFDFKETGLKEYNVKEVRKAVQKIDREVCGVPQCSIQHHESEDELDEEADEVPTFTPDDALFIFTRCFSLYASKEKSRTEDGKQWIVQSEFSNGLLRTKCFLRCLLEKFHLFDMHSGKFQNEVVKAQYLEYGDFLNIQKQQVEELNKAFVGKSVPSSKCENVHEEFSKIYAAHRKTIGILFHFPQFSEAITKKNIPHLKRQDESYPEFCGKNTIWDDKRCAIRQHTEYQKNETQVDRVMSNYINCVFKGFRYITYDNQIDTDELRRDFYRSDNLDQQSREDINNCAAKARLVCDYLKGYSIYSCLLKSKSAEKFKDAFEYKEIFSGDYSLAIHLTVYRKEEVKYLTERITAKICGKTKPK